MSASRVRRIIYGEALTAFLYRREVPVEQLSELVRTAEINTAPEARREMQQLTITDSMAVDAALAPSLEALELAVRDHRSI